MKMLKDGNKCSLALFLKHHMVCSYTVLMAQSGVAWVFLLLGHLRKTHGHLKKNNDQRD